MPPVSKGDLSVHEREREMSEKSVSGDQRLWEVFVQGRSGDPHEHVGSVHAADAELALQNGRDVYSRRGPVNSIWVVPSEAIVASLSEETGAFFDPANDKVYRHPQFYTVPRGVKNL